LLSKVCNMSVYIRGQNNLYILSNKTCLLVSIYCDINTGSGRALEKSEKHSAMPMFLLHFSHALQLPSCLHVYIQHIDTHGSFIFLKYTYLIIGIQKLKCGLELLMQSSKNVPPFPFRLSRMHFQYICWTYGE
jgi:hypothetical protein